MLGTALALAVVLVEQRLHAGLREQHEPGALAHWLRDAALAVPLGIAAVIAGRTAAVGRAAAALLPRALPAPAARALAGAFVAATVFAAGSVPGNEAHARLFGAEHTAGVGLAEHALRDAAVALAAAFAFLTVVPLGARLLLGAPRPLRPALGLAVAAVLVAGAVRSPASSLSTSAAGCTSASADRVYDVVATNVAIPFNRWGDVLENGAVYALRRDAAAIRNWSRPLAATPEADPAGNRRLRPRPLVLRANAGECVQITFTNELNGDEGVNEGLPQNPRASMHVLGAAFDVQGSDGSAVGFNEDSTVPNRDDPGTPQRENQIVYLWRALEEGLYLFNDRGVPTGSEHDAGLSGFGLFGALAVEPAGSTWRDPRSGAVLSTRNAYENAAGQSGDLYMVADIVPPAGRAFREDVELAWDEIPSIGLGFNYGTEPQHNRDAQKCPDCVGEETSLSSWTYGDPALVKLASGPGPWLPPTAAEAAGMTAADLEARDEDCGLPRSCWVSNVFHAYRGDPTKIRFALAGTKETHVFHLHAHQWLAEPNDVGGSFDTTLQATAPGAQRPRSTTIDSQTFGPGETFTIDVLGGAGSKPGTIGDSIFHCHLYPHFAEGFWSLFRVHDVLEEGRGDMPEGVSGTTPDAIGVRPLLPLPGGPTPPTATPANPGYPRFIPGKFRWRAPQPPGGVTEGGPAGAAAPRIVAGRELTAEDTAVERSVQKLNYGFTGDDAAFAAKPGAPFRDPCPTGAREVTYNVSVVSRDVVYNEAGWHDEQGRLLVLDRDVEAVMSGRKEPEPLFIRVNAGDCVNFNLTNRLPNYFGGDDFVLLQQTNMVGEHIHLVKFDVLGSDGSSNGWNYQQAAFSEDQVAFNRAVLAGAAACSATEGCRIGAGDDVEGLYAGQTIHERWYADYELRTVFTHDHHFPAVDQNRGLYGALIVEPVGMDFRIGGAFQQPVNDPANGSACTSACEGTAAGTVADVIGRGANDDFREFGLSFQDFVSLETPSGEPLNPPGEPEAYPDDDPGVMAVNYKNAPFLLRDTKNGVPVDPAYTFSSWVFGDPETLLLQAYGGDPIRIRMIQGSQEEQHAFMLHGVRWRHEPDDPRSYLTNTQAIGVSEAFNFEAPRIQCAADEDAECLGDYLYSGTATDDLYLGMWGLLRVHGKGFPGLPALPDNIPQAQKRQGTPQPTGNPPPPRQPSKAGEPCPAGAPVRRYEVVAFQRDLVYNAAGDHDPYGLVYALAADEEAIRSGAKPAEPLVLRANEGDCIEVNLTNRLTSAFLAHRGAADADPRLPLEPPTGTRAGLRVSLHPQLVLYDVRGSDGATIGFNRDQTVGPGQSILYRWFADDVSPGELGATNLLDYGDLRGHRHHGLFAGLNVEPKRATWHDPLTGRRVDSGAAADIRVPGMRDFREFTTFFQDGLNLRDAAGVPLRDPQDHPPLPGEPEEPLDAEDQGEKGFNYRSAGFGRRLGFAPGEARPSLPADRWAHVFSSRLHGQSDPDTPIFRAYAGDDVRFRVLQGADKPRQHAFTVSSAAWRFEPDDPDSPLIGVQGGITVGRMTNLLLPGVGAAGDYLYNCQVSFHHLSNGLWGIMRVYETPSAGFFTPSPLRALDDPRAAGNRPLVPLEAGEITATVFDDANADAARGNGEPSLAGVPVTLRAADGVGTALATAPTAADGSVTFHVVPGVYDLEVAEPPDWAATVPRMLRADVSGENVRAAAAFGLVQLGDVTVHVFDSRNGDNVVDPGETGLSAWMVTLAGGASPVSAPTGADGRATFDGLRPGTYQASVAAAPGWSAVRPMPVAVVLAENGSVEVRAGHTRPAGLAVELFNDADGDGTQDADERDLAGWSVTVSGGPPDLPPATYERTTDARGVVSLTGILAGTYRITEQLGPGWSCARATVTNDGVADGSAASGCAGGVYLTVLPRDTAQVVTLANRNPNGWAIAEPFNDSSNDGVRQDREGKLVGWTATLYASDGTSVLDQTTTAANGQASFYPVAPGQYVLEMKPQTSPDPAVPDWTGTTPSRRTVTVRPGELATAPFGFVQLGTVGVEVWHDLDRNGTRDAYEDGSALANRNVRLWDANAKKVLAQTVTDDSGMASFKVAAGEHYQLEVLLPSGWQATAPAASNGSPVTQAKVTAPTAIRSETVRFGQYNTADSTPPPVPTATPPGGTYTATQSVALVSEAGATIRYTLDGSAPTATRGTVYSGPVTVSSSKTLKAVAVDAAGNLNAEPLVAQYTIARAGATTAPRAAPSSWTVLTGTTTPSGPSSSALASLLGANDGSYLVLRAAQSGPQHVTDGYGAYVVPSSQRNVQALTVAYDGGASISGSTRTLSLYNHGTKKWETLVTEPQTVADAPFVADVAGDPKRFVSGAGEIRLRVRATRSTGFELRADVVTFRVTYR